MLDKMLDEIQIYFIIKTILNLNIIHINNFEIFLMNFNRSKILKFTIHNITI